MKTRAGWRGKRAHKARQYCAFGIRLTSRDAVITLVIEIPVMLQSPTRSLMIARFYLRIPLSLRMDCRS
jgi:hypothetical protein